MRKTLVRWFLLMLPVLMVSGPAFGQKKDAQPPVPVVKAAPGPASAPSLVTPPADLKGAVDAGRQAVGAAREGKWWYFSSLVCLVLMFGLKMSGLLAKMGRWKYIILPILSLAAALLATFQGGVTIDHAIGVFTSSWAAGMLEELVNHGIRGQPHS